MTGIPIGQKVMVIDRDTEGVDPNDLSKVIWDLHGENLEGDPVTTELEAGDALVTIWRGESEHEDQLIGLAKLKEYMQSRDSLECYVLTNGMNANMVIIKPDADQDTILVLIKDDGTEEMFESLDDMAENSRLINLAFRCGAFYVYGYELGGC